MTVDSSAGPGNTNAASLTVLPPPTSERVYWTNGNSDKISFANLDGTGGGDLSTGAATVSGPGGVALDPAAGRVYWANFNASNISYANLDGSGGGDLATGAATVNGPLGTAVDPTTGRVYWANFNASKISYANLDGSGGGDVPTGAASLNSPQGVAVDAAGGRIYWPNGGSNKISYANLDGSGGGDVTTTGATVSTPEGVAIDPIAGRIYWANFNGNTISYANLNGSGGGDLPTGSATVSSPTGLAVDPIMRLIYWTNLSDAGISFANLGGGGGGDLSTVYASANELPALLKAPSGAAASTIAGGSTRGSMLFCSQGAWAPDLPASLLYRAPQSLAYQWSLNGTDLAGATSSSYLASTVGDYRCRVTASNFAGTASQTSAPHSVTQSPPSCQPATATTTSGQRVIVALTCTDAAGAALTYALDSNPRHGKLSAFNAATGEVTYTAGAGYAGTDGFTYHAASANGTATPQIVTITVKPKGGPRPTITAARLTHVRFRVARQATRISGRKVPAGTSFVFTLSEPASLRITISRSAAGLRSGRGCVAPNRKLKQAHAKRCIRTVLVGTLARANESKGTHRLPFSGRIGVRALTAGLYQAGLLASNTNGSSRQVKLAFTVVS